MEAIRRGAIASIFFQSKIFFFARMSGFVQVSSSVSHPCGVARTSNDLVSVLLRMKALEQHDHASRLWKVVMMVDVSMSMYHDLPRLKSSLLAALQRVPDGSLVAIYTFARSVLPLFPTSMHEYVAVTPETRERLRTAVGSITCRPGTNLEAAFRCLGGSPDTFYNCFGVCFTDGQPIDGERDPTKLAELLDPSRTVHMIAYKSGSDCWVAKAFGERSVNNIIEYCTDANTINQSIERVFPDATKLTITDITVDVAVPEGVTPVHRPISIPDTVEGTTRSLLFDFRADSVLEDVESHTLAFTVKLFGGEMQVDEKVVIQRVPRSVAVPVPAEIRAERVRQATNAALSRVQNELRVDNMVDALSAARSASLEVGSLEAELTVDDDVGYRSMIVEMSQQCQAIESAISSAHEGTTIQKIVYEETVEDDENPPVADKADEEGDENVPTYRSLDGGGQKRKVRAVERQVVERTPLPGDFLHRLVAIQNGIIRA